MKIYPNALLSHKPRRNHMIPAPHSLPHNIRGSKIKGGVSIFEFRHTTLMLSRCRNPSRIIRNNRYYQSLTPSLAFT